MAVSFPVQCHVIDAQGRSRSFGHGNRGQWLWGPQHLGVSWDHVDECQWNGSAQLGHRTSLHHDPHADLGLEDRGTGLRGGCRILDQGGCQHG